jgi:hypothetical protein
MRESVSGSRLRAAADSACAKGLDPVEGTMTDERGAQADVSNISAAPVRQRAGFLDRYLRPLPVAGLISLQA